MRRLEEEREERLHLTIPTDQKRLLAIARWESLPWLDEALRSRQGSWPALRILSLSEGSPVHAMAPYAVGYGFCGNTSDEARSRIVAESLREQFATEDALVEVALRTGQASMERRFPEIEWSNARAVESLLVSAVERKRYGLIYVLLSDYGDYQRDDFYRVCSLMEPLAGHALVNQFESHYSGAKNATTATFTATRADTSTVRWQLQYRVDDDDQDGLHEVSVFRRL